MDQGKHKARIWIYPHKGNFVEGNVTQVATELNTVYHIAHNNKNLEDSDSLINIYPQKWIHATTIKLSEDSPDWIVIRLFNSADRHIDVLVKLNFQCEEVKETNLIEEIIRDLELDIIGINNKDILNLERDEDKINSTLKLLNKIPNSIITVSESGIRTIKDVRKVIKAGCDAILMGTFLLKAKDIKQKVKTIIELLK